MCIAKVLPIYIFSFSFFFSSFGGIGNINIGIIFKCKGLVICMWKIVHKMMVNSSFKVLLIFACKMEIKWFIAKIHAPRLRSKLYCFYFQFSYGKFLNIPNFFFPYIRYYSTSPFHFIKFMCVCVDIVHLYWFKIHQFRYER